MTVEEIQEQADGSKQTVRVDAKRNSWQVDNHGVNREALIKAYDVLVKTPEDRKKARKNRASTKAWNYTRYGTRNWSRRSWPMKLVSQGLRDRSDRCLRWHSIRDCEIGENRVPTRKLV